MYNIVLHLGLNKNENHKGCYWKTEEIWIVYCRLGDNVLSLICFLNFTISCGFYLYFRNIKYLEMKNEDGGK